MTGSQMNTTFLHARGVHCATAAMRNIVRHSTGTSVSEAAVFGISSGLNFMYRRFPGARLICTNGRGTDLELNFADALGIELETSVSLDDDVAWELLKAQLLDGQVVMLDVAANALPYFVGGVSVDADEALFGGHRLLVSTFEAKSGTVMVHDYAWEAPQQLSLDALRHARNPVNCAMSPPQNRSYLFHFAGERPDLALAMRAGLLRAAPLMRNSIKGASGLPALDRFCRQVLRWPVVLSEADAYLNTRVTGYMLDKGGTGGGAFRNLYSRFLRECCETLDAPELLIPAQVYRELSLLWVEVANLLLEASKDLSAGLYRSRRQSEALLNEIWRKENEGICSVESISARIGA